MRGVLHIELRTADGAVVDRRQARNTVLQTGGQLVADLFSGRGGPITHMGVGTSDDTPDATGVTGLGNDDGSGSPGLTGAVTTAIPADAFRSQVDDVHHRIVVRVRATLPADAAIGPIREAGLVSRRADGDVLYNRVTFAPIDKADDHEVTLFWEVEFPFGDLQWLAQ